MRENWLNPPEWIERVPEVVAGYPDRIIAKPAFAAQLKQRTLTNLYNKKPAWLVNANVKLDQAVAAAYGWENDAAELNEAEILQRLLALNLARGNALDLVVDIGLLACFALYQEVSKLHAAELALVR
ncbi:hypothetical protein [Chromatium okenii]|uniref:hypothetical protein n=1 Tax=Chromatium okenii TaxID=61644 RepID=UPI0018D515CF|nr:hypothetical protein [Chromatium okenii]